MTQDPLLRGTSGLELRHLRYFLTLADARSFTRAAERLHIAQPTLSHQIKQLEGIMGAALFERRTGDVQLTTAGELFRPYCERMLKELEGGIQALSDLEGLMRGTLRMAVAHSFSTSQLPSALSEFALRYPGVRVVAQLISRQIMEQDLLSGELDLAVAYVSSDTEKFDIETLGEERLVLVVDTGHPWADRTEVRVAELASLPLVLLTPEFAARQSIDALLAERELHPQLILEMNAIEPILAVIRNAQLATVLSNGAVENVPGLRVVPLVDPIPRRTIAILWRRGGHRSAAALRMAEMIKETYSPNRG